MLGEVPPSRSGDQSFPMRSTHSPGIAEYDGTDADKSAHYMIK